MKHNASATTADNLQRSKRQTALTMTGVMLAMVLAAVNQTIISSIAPYRALAAGSL